MAKEIQEKVSKINTGKIWWDARAKSTIEPTISIAYFSFYHFWILPLVRIIRKN